MVRHVEHHHGEWYKGHHQYPLTHPHMRECISRNQNEERSYNKSIDVRQMRHCVIHTLANVNRPSNGQYHFPYVSLDPTQSTQENVKSLYRMLASQESLEGCPCSYPLPIAKFSRGV